LYYTTDTLLVNAELALFQNKKMLKAIRSHRLLDS